MCNLICLDLYVRLTKQFPLKRSFLFENGLLQRLKEYHVTLLQKEKRQCIPHHSSLWKGSQLIEHGVQGRLAFPPSYVQKPVTVTANIAESFLSRALPFQAVGIRLKGTVVNRTFCSVNRKSQFIPEFRRHRKNL